MKNLKNPERADGIVRNVDSRKQLLNPVVVDEVVQNVDSQKQF